MASQPSDYVNVLLKRSLVSPDQVTEAEALSKNNNLPLGEALVSLNYVTSEDVCRAMAEHYALDFINLAEIKIPESIVELVPETIARENITIPLSEEGDALRVILADPMDVETVEKLRFILNRQIQIALAPRSSILEAINRYYGQFDGESADSMLQEFTDTAIDFTETEDAADGFDDDDDSNGPIVRLVHLMISEAVQLRASDVHVEHFEDRIRIRYRIDGRLVERDSPPRRL